MVQVKSKYLSRSRLIAAVAVATLVLAASGIFTLPTSGQTEDAGCDLAPWLRGALLSAQNYDLPSYSCDDLELLDGDEHVIWDFSRRNLTSFAISDDDYERLLDLSDLPAESDPGDLDGFGRNEDTRLIDLTGNPLTVRSVDFRNIPVGVGIALSASNVQTLRGFQSDVYQLTENSVGYVSIALPGVLDRDEQSIVIDPDLTGDTELASIGRDMLLHGDAYGVVYYWPVHVRSDNENDSSGSISVELDENSADSYDSANGSGRGRALDLSDFLDHSEAELDIADADSPRVEVCHRTRVVEDAIEDALPRSIRNNGCDITLADLGTVTELELEDDDGEVFDLADGDLDGLTGIRSLGLIGVDELPRGIFVGVGDIERGLVIDFAENDPDRSGDPVAGNYTPSSLPGHILDFQEPHQTLLLSGDRVGRTNQPQVTGLDREIYFAGNSGDFVALLPVSYTGDVDEELTHYAIGRLGGLGYEFNRDSIPVADDVQLDEVDAEDDDVAYLAVRISQEELDSESTGQLVLFIFKDDSEEFDGLVDWAYIDTR